MIFVPNTTVLIFEQLPNCHPCDSRSTTPVAPRSTTFGVARALSSVSLSVRRDFAPAKTDPGRNVMPFPSVTVV